MSDLISKNHLRAEIVRDVYHQVQIHARGSSMSEAKPQPLWPAVLADLARFKEEGPGFRPMIRGILSQGFQALFVYRVFRWLYERRVPAQPFRFLAERLIEITTGISIPVEACIGKGLRIHHFGGIIVHPQAVVGEGCTIYHEVTLGDLGGRGGAPRIGNGVLIGAGAKVIGNIEVGDNSLIGANAVVLTSVPTGHLAVGVPAVVRKIELKPQSAKSSGQPDEFTEGR